MAINDLPTSTDSSNQSLRSYREATSYLVHSEHQLRKPLEPSSPCDKQPSPACGSPPRFRPNSRCRSRTPSPPHASSSSSSSTSSSSSKAPRSVSPGGTPTSSVGASLRQQGVQQRRVSWASTLVSSVQTRPRTLRKDVSMLFYSRADEKRFRREAEYATPDDDWCDSLEEDSLTSLSDDEGEATEQSSAHHKPLLSPQRERKDYGISKAVVVFGESTKTYGGGCAIEAAAVAKACAIDKGLFSFDDAAFWNGQLTWS